MRKESISEPHMQVPRPLLMITLFNCKMVTTQDHIMVSAPDHTHWLLCGKSRRWVIVTNWWLRVFRGVTLLSASIVSIFFNRSIYSLRSAFSANISVPSKSVDIFTLREKFRNITLHHLTFNVDTKHVHNT